MMDDQQKNGWMNSLMDGWVDENFTWMGVLSVHHLQV
jgi:hypothetical protein